jgi:hypothetical protein
MPSLLDQWKESPTRRRELAELMQQPAFVDALAIVKEQLYEASGSPPLSAPNLMEVYAVYGAKKAGYEAALQNLLKLAELNVHRMPDRKPWDSGNVEERAQEILEGKVVV